MALPWRDAKSAGYERSRDLILIILAFAQLYVENSFTIDAHPKRSDRGNRKLSFLSIGLTLGQLSTAIPRIEGCVSQYARSDYATAPDALSLPLSSSPHRA